MIGTPYLDRGMNCRKFERILGLEIYTMLWILRRDYSVLWYKLLHLIVQSVTLIKYELKLILSCLLRMSYCKAQYVLIIHFVDLLLLTDVVCCLCDAQHVHVNAQ